MRRSYAAAFWFSRVSTLAVRPARVFSESRAWTWRTSGQEESFEGVEPSTQRRPRERTAAQAAGAEVLALGEWAVTSARNWLLFLCDPLEVEERRRGLRAAPLVCDTHEHAAVNCSAGRMLARHSKPRPLRRTD
jgi:hypothetical protein